MILNEFFIKSDIEEILQGIQTIGQDISNKTIVITGARGFLGRYLIEIFKQMNDKQLNSPVKVFAVDNLITAGKLAQQSIDDSNIKFIEHDVTKPFSLDEEIHYIIHAAGIASPQYYQKYPLETLEVAINGTKNMLQLAKQKNARFTFFSSSEIYGDPDTQNIPTKEEYRGNVSSLGPRACYDESKRVGETLCYIFSEHFGVRTNIIRPFNFYGPGMQEKDYRVLPNFASRIKSKKPLKIYGRGDQTRTFCYITDALTGLLQVILRGKPNEIYNIGNPNPEISVVQLADMITKVLDYKIPYEIIGYPDEYPANEPNRRCPDIQKARTHLGYEPRVSLEDGLKRFLSWTDMNYIGE
jgi:UDP-glucuronate decarboxylase